MPLALTASSGGLEHSVRVQRPAVRAGVKRVAAPRAGEPRPQWRRLDTPDSIPVSHPLHGFFPVLGPAFPDCAVARAVLVGVVVESDVKCSCFVLRPGNQMPVDMSVIIEASQGRRITGGVAVPVGFKHLPHFRPPAFFA